MIRKAYLVIFVILCLQVTQFHLESENYYHCRGGPEHWGDWFESCAGNSQSPIDLPCSTCAAVNKLRFPELKRSYTYFDVPKSIKLVRTIDSVGIKPTFPRKRVISITGGPLQDHYILDHIHFHWGDKDWIGSEHFINGNKFGMEAHAVHYNAKYGNMKKAETRKDGILIIAYLYKVVDRTNDVAMDCIACALRKFHGSHKTTKIHKPFPIGLLLPPFQRRYLVYPGSLTTPPCHETVTWIVHDNILEISRNNILRFRDLYCVDPGLRNNYRPIQPLNDRIIYARP